MDTSTKHLLSLTTFAILVVIGIKFKQLYLDQDFILITEVPCDPRMASCFTKECDIETNVINCNGAPYKKVTIRAANAPECFLEASCDSFECPLTDTTCSIEYCSDDALEEEETCTTSITSFSPNIPL